MRVLKFGDGNDEYDCKVQQWLNILDKQTAFSRYRFWHIDKLNDEKYLETKNSSEKPFKVVFIF